MPVFAQQESRVEVECDCQGEAEATLTCIGDFWQKQNLKKIKTIDDLLGLVYHNLEGDEDSLKCFLNSDPIKKRGCKDVEDDCLEACADCSTDLILAGMIDIARNGPTLEKRLGALMQVSMILYRGWGDHELPAKLQRLYDHILDSEDEPLLLTTVLQFHGRTLDQRPETMRRAIRLAASDNKMVRISAIRGVELATGAPLLKPIVESGNYEEADLEAVKKWYEKWLYEGGKASRWPRRRVAITIDDLPVNTRLERKQWRPITEAILSSLKNHQASAIGFVNSGKCEQDGVVDSDCQGLMRKWLEGGFDLGNHSAGHPSLHKLAPEKWIADVRHGESWLRKMVEGAGKSFTYFRHPYLHTGRTPEIREQTGKAIKNMGYTVAPVTIDNSEWIYAFAYDRALLAEDKALAERIAEDYIRYMGAVVAFYEDQSFALLGYELPQILLIHANKLNADKLNDLLAMLRWRGYDFITLEEALKDEAYESEDQFFGGGGITWLHRWALTQGKQGEFFRGEPVTPDWVKDAAEVAHP